MKRKSSSYMTKDGAFEYGYCAKESDMAGRMYPEFRPFWQATYLGDCTTRRFDTKRECLDWIREWYDPDVADNGDPRLTVANRPRF